jgi:hypothetical protein
MAAKKLVSVRVFVTALLSHVLFIKRKNDLTGGCKYEFLCSNICINGELVVLMLHSSQLQEKSCGHVI